MILDLFQLNGKTALVTGANTGLGQGICIALAQAGANVIGAARRSCAETAEKIAADGGHFDEIITDLSQPGVQPIFWFQKQRSLRRLSIFWSIMPE